MTMETTTSAPTATGGTEYRSATRAVILRWLERFFLYGVLTVGALVFVAPLIWLVSTSLKPESEVFLFPPSLIGSRLQFEDQQH